MPERACDGERARDGERGRWVRGLRGALVIALLARATAVDAQPSPTAIVDRMAVNTQRQIDFHAAAFPETLYVGQQTTYQLAVYLTDDARGRLRRNPEFTPPEVRGLLSYELGAPRRATPARAPNYEALVFQRALFPVAAGVIDVPAPQLSYALPQSSSYFSREERFVVRAESAHLVVRAVPEAGRPSSYSGAVGVLRSEASVDTIGARVGDPLPLTIRLTGIGNVKLLPRPTVEIPWAGVVAGTERVEVDTTGALVRGVKEFDWILTPTQAGVVTVPPIAYSYFDPYKGAFQVAETETIVLNVRVGSLAGADIGESAAELLSLRPMRGVETDSLARARGANADSGPGRDGIFANRQSSPFDWMLRGRTDDDRTLLLLTLALVLIAPAPALLLLVTGRDPARIAGTSFWSGGRTPMQRGGAAVQYDAPQLLEQARLLQSDVTADPGARARGARRALHSALAARLQVPARDLSTQQSVRRILRRHGVTAESTQRVIALLAELDAVGYGVASAAQSPAPRASSHEEAVSACVDLVDREAVRSRRRAKASGRRSGSISLALAVLLSTLPVAAGGPMSASVQLMNRAPRVQRYSSRDARWTVSMALPVPQQGEATGAVLLPAAVDPAAGKSYALDQANAAADRYARRAFRDAADAFGLLVRDAPNDASLLTNWGTAAWAAGDTVNAVIAWQRAARIEPLAADLHERFNLLPGGSRGGVAEVPAIPVRLLEVIALLTWLAGWALLAVALRRRRATQGELEHVQGAPTAELSPDWLRTVAWSCVGAAALLGGLAIWGRGALDASALEVVTRPETMRVAPGTDADAMGGVGTGDVVRRLSLDGNWEEVLHADGRRGWLPSVRLVPVLPPSRDAGVAAPLAPLDSGAQSSQLHSGAPAPRCLGEAPCRG